MVLSHHPIGTDRVVLGGDTSLAGLTRLVGMAPLVGLVLLVLLLPPSAAGQDGAVPSLIERGRQAGADPDLMREVVSRAERAGHGSEQTAELLRPAVSLAEKGLPTEPLLNKTLEGLAKQVPSSRMAPVLQTLQTNTERAGAVVSTWLSRDDVKQLIGDSKEPSAAAREEMITTATEAQQQNVPIETIEQFLDALPTAVEQQSVALSQVATAVRVMPDLPGAESNAQVTQQLLTAALNAGYDGEEIRQLPAALESAQRQTQRPGGAVARGAAQAIAQGTPAARVLRSLFQGSVPGGGPPASAGNGPPDAPPGQGKPPGQEGKPPGAGSPDNPGGGPPDDNPGGGPPDDNPGGGGGG